MRAKIIELHEAGQTPEDILATLQADPRHVRDVKATGGNIKAGEFDLLHVLVARLKILRLGSAAEWKGSLITAVNALDESNPLRIGMEILLSNLQVTGRDVFCHSDPETGGLMTGVTAIAKSIVQGEGAEAWQTKVQTELDSLTGGRMFADVTLEEIQKIINQHAIEPVWTAKQAVVEQGIFDGTITTLDQIVAAIGGE